MTAETSRMRPMSNRGMRRVLSLSAWASLAILIMGPKTAPWTPQEARASEPPRAPSARPAMLLGDGSIMLSSIRPSEHAEESAGVDGQPERPWQLIEGRSWQISGPPGEPTAVTDAREDNRGSCPAGMVQVTGKMKTHPKFSIDGLQLQTCTKWIQREWPERCAAYDRARWLEQSKDYPTQSMSYCMDRFEYPNQKGVYPIIMVSWYEARNSCKAQGKRLCSEDEWTFACEGEEAMPYPTGYARDANQCVIDEHWDMPNGDALLPRDTGHARAELERLFRGQASGGSRSCKSPFGVYDMTGNVDEWTHSSIPGERPSILKGGYFGPVRTRCRPSTRAHGEGHVFYQQGFRCCADR
jgi:formylglycine-generating enzyme